MNRNLLKKCMIGIIMVAFLFLFVTIPQLDKVIARDLSDSTSWSGDLPFDTLKPVTYETDYRPFELIIDQPQLIEESHIYVIEKATDLYHLSRLTLGEHRLSYLAQDYVLGNDIDYYDAVLENINFTFNPIGVIEPFTGTFNGQGFEITNLYFTSILDEDSYEMNFQGMRFLSMFSNVSASAHIHHFGLVNPIMIQPIEWGNMRYASYIAGENNGVIEHVYVKDTRKEASGMHVDGAFHMAGLVSVNKGILRDLWIAAPYVRSRAVTHALSVHPLLSDNLGTMTRVYFDDTLYSESVLGSLGLGLETEQFQVASFFSSDWYFNDAYHGLVLYPHEIDQVKGHDVYPSLQGLQVTDHKLLIQKPVDMIVMQKLLMRSGYFRKSTFVLDHDIDMAMVSRDAYRAQKVSFNGTFTSNVMQSQKTLYPHEPANGGAYGYYTIFNLSLHHIENQFAYDTIGLFNVLFGKISHLNFRSVTLSVNQEKIKSNALKIGILAGEMIHGSIENVHVDGQMMFTGTPKPIQNMVIGGFAGEASGTISSSSITGLMSGAILEPQSTLEIKQGGLVGSASNVKVDQNITDMDMTGFYTALNMEQFQMIGGVLGYGSNVQFQEVVYTGHMTYQPPLLNANHVYIGGLFGLLKDTVFINQALQKGVLTVLPKTSEKAVISGLGHLDNSTFKLARLTHQGSLFIDTSTLLLTEEVRYHQQIELSLGLNIKGSSGHMEGLFNRSSVNVDATYVDGYATLLYGKENSDIHLFHLENKGHVNMTTSDALTQEKITYTMMVYGENMHLEHLRNTGDMLFNIGHHISSSYPMSSLNLSGITNVLSEGFEGKDIFQGGEITLKTLGGVSFDADVYVAGIVLHHLNTAYSIHRQIDPTSINFVSMDGPLHNVLNTGDLQVSGTYAKHIYNSGIVYQQHGLMTKAFNLGDIFVSNTHQTTSSHASASGITSLLIGPYATVMDSANSGNIHVTQMSVSGTSHASGIVIRNDLKSDLTQASPLDNHHLSKIAFTINYGDVYAWGETNESSHTISNQSKVKSAGILAMGVLSVVNNVNYGHIYSKYTASGFIGLIPLNHFGTLNPHEVYMSNLIQYGKVRQITAYDWVEKTYTESQQLPTRTAYYAFGAMVGKIHTGTQSWAFAGNVTYPIDRIYFGYLINMDDMINMFDNAPDLSSSWADGFGNLQEANQVILNMLAYMGTSKLSDNSKPPFTYFYQGGWVGQYMGKVIDHYSISDHEGGFFSETFPFRSSRPVYSGTDQYIHDYIAYIDKDHANPELIARLEVSTGQSFPGLYALSSSEGINEGIFMPDNLDILALSPYSEAEGSLDTGWLGEAGNEGSIAYMLYTVMRQTRASFAATIYDLELTQSDASGAYIPGGITLNSPVIDQTRKMLTYYLPSNAQILTQTSSSLMNVYRFIEVSEGLGRKVPDLVVSGEQTYSWIGDYKKSGDHFVEIGPYHTTGTVMLQTSDLEPVTSYARGTPVYGKTDLAADATLSTLFKHIPHTYVLFWWQATGYRVNATTGFAPGYGAYEPYTLANYPTLYRYVGPSRENVTYIQTDVEENVVVFNDAEIYFGVNPNSDRHLISQGASLTHQGLTEQSVSSVPRSYGVYEAMYDEHGNYIDSVQDHYGKIRIFSASFDPLDPASYQDYDIRIIRTSDQSLSAIESLMVSDMNALPESPLVSYTTSTQNMMPIEPYQKGIVNVSYETLNVADLQNMTSRVHVRDKVSFDLVDQSLYDVKQGINQTLHAFDNKTGSWGTGHVSFSVEFDELLPSGTYEIVIELITGDVYVVSFEKMMSHHAEVLSVTYQGQQMDVSGGMLTSDIPFGLFYDPNDVSTKPVNFSNLSDIESIGFNDLVNQYPVYLDAIMISTFSHISFVSLEIDKIDGMRHRYTIIYEIVAEDLTTKLFTHQLIEKMPSLEPNAIYDNGTLVSGYVHQIGYNHAPTFRIAFDLSNVYVSSDLPWLISSTFTPLQSGDQALLGSDYVTSIMPELGYEVDFIKETPMGTYAIFFTYQQEVELWGEVLTWHVDYQTMQFNKVMNEESMLTDILFVSDAVFQGFNTIIDPAYIISERYQFLLLNPSEREVIQLPTTGIVYLDQGNMPTYYIIGQVQQTHLSYYMPQMMIPDGAIIKKVVDDANLGPEHQSDNLYADFSPLGDAFNFIHYRIYAMDYHINPTHYTDYYVAVQDMTNMIRFDVTLVNEALIPVENIHIRISICQTEIGNETCARENEMLSMGIFSSYINGSYVHPVFQTTTYGTYKIEVFLPDGYTYTMAISEVTIIGNAFYVENSIFPRKVYMTLTIQDELTSKPWGNEHIKLLEPQN